MTQDHPDFYSPVRPSFLPVSASKKTSLRHIVLRSLLSPPPLEFFRTELEAIWLDIKGRNEPDFEEEEHDHSLSSHTM